MAIRPQLDSLPGEKGSAPWGGRATRAVVDLDAIAENIRQIHALVYPAEVLAVVKADGYGHGAPAVARAALAGGAGRLAVYTTDEGRVLREAGIDAPVLLFGSFTDGEAPVIWRDRLTPTIASLESALVLDRHRVGEHLPFHVKVDTGLTRAGLPVHEVLVLLRALDSFASLQPEGIYTHFACADEPGSATTAQQLQRFTDLLAELQRAGYHFPVRHAANSAGALNFPAARLDLVRIGISAYGYYSSPETARDVSLRPALSLVSRITRLTRIEAGQGVGYSHEYRAPSPRLVALTPIGYGDGLPRSLGCGLGRVLVRGKYAPIIGRVSMDQITLDVTDVPAVEVGDEVVLLGRQGNNGVSADDIAAATGTISYEVLTRITSRVPRLYTESGRIVTVRTPFSAIDVPYVSG